MYIVNLRISILPTWRRLRDCDDGALGGAAPNERAVNLHWSPTIIPLAALLPNLALMALSGSVSAGAVSFSAFTKSCQRALLEPLMRRESYRSFTLAV